MPNRICLQLLQHHLLTVIMDSQNSITAGHSRAPQVQPLAERKILVIRNAHFCSQVYTSVSLSCKGIACELLVYFQVQGSTAEDKKDVEGE